MYHITIVYINQNNEYQAFHVHNANTEKLQKEFEKANIYALEHILEQHRTVAINEFKIYSSQSELVDFINKWNLNY